MSKRKKDRSRSIEPPPKSKIWVLLGGFLGLALISYIFVGFGRERDYDWSESGFENLNVILITIDTLRADFVGAYGAGRASTPHLDRLADEGVLFEKCIAQVPLTLPSHVTILSGTYPLYHRVNDNGGFMVPGELRLASEVLQERGFATSAFVSAFVLHSKWGINQGFDRYSDDFDRTKYGSMLLQNEKPAEVVLEEAKSWLRTNKSSRFFTWIHLFEPHSPYVPPPPFDKYPDEPYRGEVEYVDQAVGDFVNFLEEQGLFDKTLLIVTSDHGEGLGQHGEEGHGIFVYEPTVWVPLVIRAPFRFPVRRVQGLVELVDIAPTLLDVLGIPVPDSYQGESLLGRMLGDEPKERGMAYAETFYPRLHYGWSELRALYREEWKYIWAPDEELYRLDEDGREKRNLVETHSTERHEFGEELRRFIESKSVDGLSPAANVLEEDDRRRLEALGYVTDSAVIDEEDRLPDPKDKLAALNAIEKATSLADEGRYDEALGMLNAIIAEEPETARAHTLMGQCFYAKGMYSEALRSQRQVLTLKPDDNFAKFEVVTALLQLGEHDQAVEEAEAFLAVHPEDHNLLEMLGFAYFYKSDYENAVKFLEKSIRIEESSSALSKLGEIHAMRKDYPAAESFIGRALKINPKSKGSYYHLALVEEAKGDVRAAIGYYRKELENYPNDYRASYNLANDLQELGDQEGAIEYYRSTVRANPRFNMGYFMIAKYNLERNDNLEEAVALCKKGVQIEPRDRFTLQGYQILMQIYAKRGDRANYDYYLAKGDALYKILKERGQIPPH